MYIYSLSTYEPVDIQSPNKLTWGVTQIAWSQQTLSLAPQCDPAQSQTGVRTVIHKSRDQLNDI